MLSMLLSCQKTKKGVVSNDSLIMHSTALQPNEKLRRVFDLYLAHFKDTSKVNIFEVYIDKDQKKTNIVIVPKDNYHPNYSENYPIQSVDYKNKKFLIFSGIEDYFTADSNFYSSKYLRYRNFNDDPLFITDSADCISLDSNGRGIWNDNMEYIVVPIYPSAK